MASHRPLISPRSAGDRLAEANAAGLGQFRLAAGHGPGHAGNRGVCEAPSARGPRGKTRRTPRGTVIGELAVSAGDQPMLVVGRLPEKRLSPGKNRLVLSLTGGNRLPLRHNGPLPHGRTLAAAGTVAIERGDPSSQVELGQTAQLSATLSNDSDSPVPLPLAILGLPAGMEVHAEQLQEMKRQGVLADFVVRPRNVVCCWRWLPAQGLLQARSHGRHCRQVPAASRAYLLENPEQAATVKPIEIEVSRQ